MYQIHRWLAALLLLSATLACTKDDTPEPPSRETEVYGRIVLRGTNHKATNFPCTIRAYYYYPVDWGSYRRDTMAVTTTDTNGYYRLKFTAPKLDNAGFFIRLETPLANHYNPTDMQHNIRAGQKQELNLNYTPYAWLRIHVNNISPAVNDEFTVHWGSESFKFYGPITWSIKVLGAGNATNIIYYNLRRNGIHLPDTTHVYLTAFDTTHYYLEY